MKQPTLTIVLPTYNEAANIRPLLAAIRSVLDFGTAFYEIVFVDDSNDQTPEIIAAETKRDARIRLLHRPPVERTGLATALLLGFQEASGEYVCSLDADLQHPPEKIPLLLDRIRETKSDIVVASRYIAGGGADGLGTPYRRFVSVASKYLAQILFSGARNSTDPGSGFFIFRRRIIDNIDLRPTGFKMLLEILVRAKYDKVAEVPYVFLSRANEQSKASIKQGLMFLQHLWTLFITIPDAARFIKFGMVGTSGVVVNLGSLFLLVEHLHVTQTTSWAIALIFSILSNFMLNNLFTYHDRRASSRPEYIYKLLLFFLGTLIASGANYAVYSLLFGTGVHYLVAAGVGILAAMLINFSFSNVVVWSARSVITHAQLRNILRSFITIGVVSVFLFSIFYSVQAASFTFTSVLTYSILILTTLLIAQSVFALFLMLYAWEDPERIEGSKSPSNFTQPKLSFTALIPARHEEEVIGDTLKAVSAINYPEHLKETLVICRSDDTGTIQAAKHALSLLGKPNTRLVLFDGFPINKPHGLNIGLKEAKNDIVTIFDAEDEPHPDIYHVVNTLYGQSDADIIQSGVQLMNYRSNWYSVFNVLEYFFWFKSSLHFFARSGFIPLGGNTVFFKRSLLNAAGGWDQHGLTEDADIGVRLSVMGAKTRVVYDAQHVTREETPPTVASLIKQRTRWNQGFLQIFLKGDWHRLPNISQRLLAAYVLLWPFVQAFLFFYIPFALYVALKIDMPVVVAMVTAVPLYLLILQQVTYMVGLYEFTKEYHYKLPLTQWMLMPFTFYLYQLLLAYSAFRATFRLLRANNTWEKTAHTNAHRVMEATDVMEPMTTTQYAS